MKQQEEQAFENAQKQVHLDTIDIIPLQHPSHKSNQNSRSRQDVAWKFNAISHPKPSPSSPQKYTRNISFEDDNADNNSEDDISFEDEYRQSSFIEYYSNYQEVYRKKLGFGTNWIGRKQYYTSTFVDPSRIEKHRLQYYTPDSPFDMEEVPDVKCGFDSQFQSGNLHSVYKVDQWEYDLLLQNDLNTKGNTQWFYFRIINPPKNKTITLNIVNFRKTDSLFNYGLMPCIYSMEQFKKNKKGWFRGGKAIKYFKNNHQIENSRRYYYTLTFKISTPHDKDVLLIAHSFPYTLTDLNRYTDSLFKIKYKRELLEKETLLNTIGNNKIEVLTIKDPTKTTKNKPLILVIARQHPGQTPGSFVCEGLIDFFLAKDKQSEYLRKNYEIKVVPMINPDGVVAGNYRTNLFGFDLNRRWDGGGRKNMQQCTYIKRYFNQLSKSRQIAFVLDLHGHSRKLFSFFYGNPCSMNPVEPRIYPLLCSKLSPHMIRFEDSTFTSDECKRTTARIQFGSSFKIPYIYTYEVSFFGYVGKAKQKEHFTIESIKQLGQLLGRGIYLHQRGKQLHQNNPDHKDAFLYRKCAHELKNNSQLLSFGEQQNSGSESEPQQCELKQIQQEKLQQNDDYYCNKPIPKVKIVRKVHKKEPPVKQIYKSLRQMQVLDIAQVHSAFPSNIIALIPTSYITKLKKPTFAHREAQTEESPLVKIYSTCKQQDYSSFMENSTQLSPSIPVSLEKRNASNLLKSNTLNRPRTTIHEMESREYTPATHRKSRGYHRREQTASTSKRQTSNSIKKIKNIDKAVQTTLSFGRGNSMNPQIGSDLLPQSQGNISNIEKIANSSNFSHVNSWKEKNSNEVNVFEYRTIDPSYSTLIPSKLKIDSKLLGRNISKSIVENMKIRRKNGA